MEISDIFIKKSKEYQISSFLISMLLSISLRLKKIVLQNTQITLHSLLVTLSNENIKRSNFLFFLNMNS